MIGDPPGHPEVRGPEHVPAVRARIPLPWDRCEFQARRWTTVRSWPGGRLSQIER